MVALYPSSRRARSRALRVLLALALLGTACEGGDAQRSAGPDPTVIGAGGGTITEPGGASVVVPPGALDSDVTIRVARDATGAPALPAGLPSAGETFAMTPHGTVFAEPVEVRIPAPDVVLQPNEELKLAQAEPGGGWVVLSDSTFADGVLSAQVRGFSYFMAVRVAYTLALPQMPKLEVTNSLRCAEPAGDHPCDALLGRAFAWFTVSSNSGQYPIACSQLYARARAHSWGGTPSTSTMTLLREATFPLGGGELFTLSAGFNGSLAYLNGEIVFDAFLSCDSGLKIQFAPFRFAKWIRSATYPDVRVMRMPASQDVVAGRVATVDAVLSGGAVKLDPRADPLGEVPWAGPTASDRAVIDWQQSNDGGASWRLVGRSYQDEAQPRPVADSPVWQYWKVSHGIVPTDADHGALIRVIACYTPPVPAAPLPCVFGPVTRLNVLQQSALPAIVDAPRSVLVRTGQTASFSATAGGAPTPTLQWQTRAANSTGAWTDVTTGTGATTGSFTTAVLALADTGTQYRVVATNAVGSAASVTVTVSVSDLDVAPTITTQPSSLSVTAGSDAVFAVDARGTEALGYQWRRDGTPIPGANSPVLRLAAVGAIAAGGYSVVVTNAAGTATSDVATLTVGAGVSAVVAPTIVTQPSSVFVSTGNTATFAVGVTGSGPLAFQWRKDGVALPGATSAALTLAGVTSGDAGVYSVVVSNSAGSVTSADASLELVTAPPPNPTAPVITTQPSTLVVMPGAAATLAVAASGSGPLAYQWSRDGSAVGGATGPVLLLANVTSLEAGSYTVTIANTAGTVTSAAAQVILVGAPAITAQPASASAVEGGTAVFSVSATGEALRYQWLRNGAGVDGATGSTFTTPSLALADGGAVYSVLVYNAAGLVASQPAVLTVTAAPVVTIPTLASVKLGTGIAPNNRSSNPSISANGRRVAFMSDGTNLVAGTTGFGHAYLRDLATGITTLINARPDGGESARAVVDVELSGDGRYAVFTSLANDLVAGDTNVAQDVFLRDLETGTTTRLNVLPDGSQDVVSGGGIGGQIDISADGRWVLMSSGVNLAGDGAVLPDGPRLFLRDTQAGTTRAMAGVDAYGAANLSPSGRFVVVVTPSRAGVVPFMNHLLLHDVAANSTVTLLDVDASTFPDGIYGTPSISDDGRFVAFGLRSSTLLGGATAARAQVVVLDRQAEPAGALTIQSVTDAGVFGDGPSERPELSADGRYLLFGTNAPNLAGDPGATFRHYLMLRDLVQHTTRVASRRLNGSAVPVSQANHVLSGDGAVLAFVAFMGDMVSPTTPGENQVFAAPRP